MGKSYYRLDNIFNWQATSGNALFAIANSLGSNKVINIRSIEITPFTTLRGITPYSLSFVTSIIGGEEIPLSSHDGSASSLPSGVRLVRNCGVDGTINPVRKTLEWWSCVSPAATNPASLSPLGITGGFYLSKRNRGRFYETVSSITEPITVRTNQSIAIVGQVSSLITPVWIDITIVYNNKTYSTSYYAFLMGEVNCCPFGLTNTTALPVKITQLSVKPAGTTDTPFFRVVPILGIQLESLLAQQQQIAYSKFIKFDTNAPTLTNNVLVAYENVSVIPSGVPAEYASAGGVAAPKGVNYLHTKDYVGPEYMVYFPEMRTASVGAIRDDLGLTTSKKYSRIKNNITLRSGEGLAIVSSAETLSTFGGTSSYPVNFGFDIEVADIEYKLTLINIKSGSEVRIYQAGTINEITGAENITSGVFEYSYTYEPNTYIDIVVHHLSYLYYRIDSYLLGSSNSVLPIQQISDRQYFNQ